MRAMKDSGIAWIGEVPQGWTTCKTKNLFTIKKNIAKKLGYEILSVTQSGLKTKDISSNEGQIAQDYSKYQIVEPGDFVMNHMDLLTGWVDNSTVQGVTSPDYRVFRLLEDTANNKRYFTRIFQTCYQQKIYYSIGQGVSNLGRWRLQTDKFQNFELPLPSLQEQTAIANYLDDKCAKIDTTIEREKQHIEKLKEYRQSVITEAVTKGLDPTVPMKDSGIEWIGEVPKAWEIRQLKYIANIYTGNSISDSDKDKFTMSDNAIPYISTKDIEFYTNIINYENGLYIPQENTGFKISPEKSILLCIEGGSAGKKIAYTDRKVCFVNKLCCFSCGKRYSIKFLYYICQSDVFLTDFFLNITGLIGGVSVSQIKRIFINSPPLSEQTTIADYLDRKTAQIDSAIDKKETLIEKLSEYKKSLIYEAVTGKVCVS